MTCTVKGNDFLGTISYLAWMLRLYGVYPVTKEELESHPPTKCQRFIRSIPALLIFLYSLFWTSGLVRAVMTKKSDDVNLCFYVILIIFSTLTLLSISILVFKRNRLEKMLAEVHHTIAQMPIPVIPLKSRRAVICYVILPFIILFCTLIYVAYLMHTGFESEERLYEFIILVSDDGFLCSDATVITDADPLNINSTISSITSDCARLRTYIMLITGFVWVCSLLNCLFHSVGIVILTISCIYNYQSAFIAQFSSPEEVAVSVTKWHGEGDDGDFWSTKVYGRYSEENIRRCIYFHKSGCHLVKEANGALKELCFILSAAEVLIIIFSFRGMNLRNPEEGLGMKIVFSNLVAYFTFIGRAIFASQVNRRVMSSLKVMLKVEPKLSSECPTPKVAKWIKGYVKHVKLDPPAFTGWGLYRFTEGCILTVSGHILTYTLTLYGIGG